MKQIISTISKEKYQLNKLDERVNSKIQSLIKQGIYTTLVRQARQKTTEDNQSINDAILQGLLVYSEDKQGFLINKVPSYLLTKLKEVYSQGDINYRTGAFVIDKGQLIPSHLQSILKRNDTTNVKIEKILETASTLVLSLNQQNIKDLFTKEADIYAKLTQRTVEKTTKQPFNMESFKQKYLDSLETQIKGLTSEQTRDIRKRVLDNIEVAKRNNGISDILQEQYNKTKSRADLIARQESQVAIITYEQEKYNSMGIYKFKWRHPMPNRPTSRKQHVQWHKESLAGRIFDSRNPPYDEKSGKKVMPGELPHCHCVAVWIQD